jgi:hypothetical protein
MLFTSSITSPMLCGSTPRTMTPARFEGLEIITSPLKTGVAATTPGTARTRAMTSSEPDQATWLSVSITMWALLPRIFRRKSWLKPPMTLTTLDCAQALTATPQMDSTLMTVRNPLFCDLTWRALTKDSNLPCSSRSKIQGKSAKRSVSKNRTPLEIAEDLTSVSFSDHIDPRRIGSRRVHMVSAANATPRNAPATRPAVRTYRPSR